MATTKKTGASGEAAALPVASREAPTGPVFVPFRWVDSGEFNRDLNTRRLVDMTERVRDLAGGLSVVLGMLEREEIDEGCGDEHGQPLPRLFSNQDRGNLLRMSVAVSDVLCRLADDEVEFFRSERLEGLRAVPLRAEGKA